MAPYAFVSRVFVAVFLLFPLAARAQGFSFCTDLDDVVKAAPQHFHGIGPDAMPGAEKCGLAQAGGKASSFGCIWHLSMGDEKSGTIWISKRIERCFPKWTYKPNYNSA